MSQYKKKKKVLTSNTSNSSTNTGDLLIPINNPSSQEEQYSSPLLTNEVGEAEPRLSSTILTKSKKNGISPNSNGNSNEKGKKSINSTSNSNSINPKDYIKKENRSLYKEDVATQLAGKESTIDADNKSKKPKINQRLTFYRLLGQARPERCLLINATIALFLAAIFNLGIPALVGSIIDSISSSNVTDSDWIYIYMQGLGYGSTPRDVLNVSVVVLLLLVVLAAFFSCLRGYWFTLAGERVVARLRSRLFNHILSMEVGFFDVTRTGELINRLSADTTILKDAVTINVSMALRFSATIIVGIVYLFIISWKLTLVMLAVVPLVAVCAMMYGGRIRLLSKATQDALAHATETADESVSHIRTVRSFSKEWRQCQLYAEKVETTYLLGAKIAWYYGLFIGFITLIASGAMILVLWYGAVLVLNGEITPGVLTSYVLYTLTVGMSLAGLSGLFAQFMQAIGACERVFELFDRKPHITDIEGIDHKQIFQGKIVLDDVSFSYPARPEIQVLQHINLALHPGSITALVGPSGQGKSTIVSLIERFYDVTGGQILIDGINIKQLSLSYLHRHVALVQQEPVLFATTIRSNLTYGLLNEPDEKAIIKACEMANAWSFITTFPEGLETMVGERGVRLSGGQKQRIAIARAILLDPKVLIADEATSSLDAESEFHVQQALDRLMEGRTVLIIAHRLSTVKGADNVVVISKGKVEEQGTHSELLKRGGSYAKLVARQLAGNEEIDEEIEEEKEGRRIEKRRLREADEMNRRVANASPVLLE